TISKSSFSLRKDSKMNHVLSRRTSLSSKFRMSGFASVLLLAALQFGCESSPKEKAGPVVSSAVGSTAQATLEAKSNSKTVKGARRFTQLAEGVEMVAHVEGVKPNSEDGFHIHGKGDCSAADASSAGGHFDPHGHQHGAPEADQHHVGDMGNIKAN